MLSRPLISFVIPIYNRPEEVRELLASFLHQGAFPYEIVLIEDGSKDTCQTVVTQYSQRLAIRYKQIPNGGPSNARNVGVELAQGDWYIFLDSDVVLPKGYLAVVFKLITEREEKQLPIDLFGGADAAATSFSPIQKAINYSMTSPLTTGGIRGRKRHVGRYCPRTYNMGCRRTLFEKIKGFDATMRFGEDIDFCLRAYEAGAEVLFVEDAWVYHKRRVDFRKFFKQVYNSGIARIHLSLRHPRSLHLVHLLPALATCTLVLLLLLPFAVPHLLFIPLGIALILFVDAFVRCKSVYIALLAVVASLIQIIGYGTGFLVATWRRYIRGEEEFKAFEKSFYQ